MTDKNKDALTALIGGEEKHLRKFLSENDTGAYTQLIEELKNNYDKDLMFRTEVEMRFSVLDDGRHPTRGSKYWQSVKEQNSHMLGLMNNSFDYRENEIEIKKIKRKLETEEDELEIEMLNLELDKKMWTRRNTTFEGKHRIREITAWSKIKKELDNGSFSTNNVEEHQLESYQKMYQNKAKSVTNSTSQGDVFNIYSQLQTVTRILEEKKQLEKSKEKKKLES